MRRGAAVRAGLIYFAVVYTVGFVLGMARTLLVAPAIGDVPATLIELPLMIFASYVAARAVIDRVLSAPTRPERTVMGAAALMALLTAEAAMAGPMRGWSLADWIASFATFEGALTLLAFALFGLMPVIVGRRLP